MEGPAGAIGRRVLVIGTAGSRKSTFSRALSARTSLPLIHLDVQYWKPGWVKPSEDEWRETQRSLLAGDAWIADGNDLETLELRLERADTVVLLDTPWWTCASRAFMRGLRKPVGEMPEGCENSAWRRLRDEWQLVGIILRDRVRSLNADARSSLGTGDMQPRTCSVQSEQSKSFSIWGATDYDIWVVDSGFCHTDMTVELSLLRGSRFKSAYCACSLSPTICAIRSSSEGHTYRQEDDHSSTRPSSSVQS